MNSTDQRLIQQNLTKQQELLDYRKYGSDLRCVSLLIPKNLLDQVESRSGTYTILKGKLVADLQSRGTAVLGSCNFFAIEVQEIST